MIELLEVEMKNVYLKAAKLVSKKNNFSCNTINIVVEEIGDSKEITTIYGYEFPEVIEYSKIFNPIGTHINWYMKNEFGEELAEPSQEYRIMMLLLMQEIAND